uniref:Proline dehydrogenase n=1 Tax=Angiostrongylus cantonensis TaxID=6313 RepID=A0A0K0DBJ6_ANGCA
EFGVKAESQVIRDWFKTVDFDGDGYVDFHGWSKILDDHVKLGSMFKILNIKTGQLEPLIQNLTAKEEQEFSNMMRRLIDIAEHAIARGVRVMVDAEQTYFQPAISRIVLEMMRRYNHQHGNIFNTYQAYLRNTLDVMECDMQLARREGWHFGLKLVRGAYMEQERKRAASVGYPDPINPDYESTSRMYHACLERIAEEHARRGKGAVSVMIATHNEDTVRFAVNLMRDRAIAPSEKIMCFAQLYAMCDQVSFSLGQASYSVYKYLPYGPVEKVLPYLSRRAVENSSILKNANKERVSPLVSRFWKNLW